MIGRATPRTLAAAFALAGLAWAAVAWAAHVTSDKHDTFVSIGTGETNGLYYPVARAICRTIEADLSKHNVRCSPETTPGSVYNIAFLRSGELEFAIVQSDVQQAASKGTGPWKDKPATELRSVLSLYPELVTVIVRKGLNVRGGLADLVGHRVNVGSQGTGTRATWDAIAAIMDPVEAGKVKLSELRADETTMALCSGEIDADLLIVGHPSPLVASQLAACPSNLVALAGPVSVRMLETHPLYVRGVIRGKLYGLSEDVTTFGSRATLITSASTDAHVVAAVTRAILTHVAELRAAHPALADLDAQEMTQGLTAPLHPAAAEVFKELGLLK